MRSTKPFTQERLAKDDIRLLIEIVENHIPDGKTTDTRLQLLIGKLKRMEKQ